MLPEGIKAEAIAAPTRITFMSLLAVGRILDDPLVVRHSDFDVLIPSQPRIGKLSGGRRISMLLGTPGWRRMKPFRSRVTIIWWTDGGLTRKWRWMSASAGGCPNMNE